MTNTAETIESTDLLNNDYVVVPDAKPGRHVGLQVHWRLAGSLDQTAVNEALKTVLPERLLPVESGDTKYLKRAMEAIRSNRSRNLVRKLDKKAGFSLVAEHAESLDLGETPTGDEDPVDAHEIQMTAKIIGYSDDGTPQLKITPEDHPQADLLREEFMKQRGLYQASSDLSTWLSQKIIPYVSGVSGRDRGGFYYIPAGDDVGLFEAVQSVLKSVSKYDVSGRLLAGVKIYSVPAVLSDSLVEAMVDSLCEEVEDLTKDLGEKVEENKLTLRGWEGQRKHIIHMEEKLSKYADLLGVGFETLSEKLNAAANNIGFLEAKLMVESGQE